MSAAKIGLLVFYAIVAAVAVSQAGTTLGAVAKWTIIVLIVVHVLEMIVHFRLCQRAGGSLVGNLFNVLIFGILHAKEMKATVPQQ